MKRCKGIGICSLAAGILLLLFSLPCETFFAVLAVVLIAAGIFLLCRCR